MTDTLAQVDFGSFVDAIHRRFESAYGFHWNQVVNEPESAGRARAVFRQALAAVNTRPPDDHSEDLELLVEAGEFRERLKSRLLPGGGAWVDRVRGLRTSTTVVSQLLTEMCEMRSRIGGPREHAACEGAVAALVMRWADVDVDIERSWQAAQRGWHESGEPQGTELRRIQIEIDDIRVHLRNLVQTLGGGHPAYMQRHLGVCRRALATCDELSESLLQAIAIAPPLVSPENPFLPILVRLVGHLGVTVANVYADNGSALRPLIRRELEIPEEYLALPRTFEEQRDALLCWFATCRRDFWRSLPSSCLRHRIQARARGGRGQPNGVMEGIAAAMILSGFAKAEPGDRARSGKALFRDVTSRCKANLTRLGQAGTLAVDPSGLKLPATESSYVVLFNEVNPGREESCIRPPLVPRLPLRFDARGERPSMARQQ